MTAQFALGTYRISDQNPEHIEAIRTAVELGVKLIDTSTNYTDGGAERAIALALRNLPDTVTAGVEIVSKYGYIQGSTLQRIKEGETFPQIVEYAPHIYHCISPEFLYDQLTRSLERLGRERIGCYLIHNPEYFLLDAINKKIDRAEALDGMYERLYGAFVALEREVQNGRIGGYGISSNSFSKPKNDPEFLPYEDLVILAENAAKEAGSDRHHFTTLQLPINLLERDGLRCAAWAKQNGLRVLANRPLNAQKGGLMYRLAEYEEPQEYYHHLNELLEMTDNVPLKNVHNLVAQLDEYKHRFGWVGEYESFLHTQIVPHVRKALKGLDAQARLAVAESIDLFLQSFAKMVAYECSKSTRVQLKNELEGCDGTLQECALDFLREERSIDYVLVGMRRPSYVVQVLGTSRT
jgi:aryl-alcohol dehydrogenase-like predicted oxidoreductase